MFEKFRTILPDDINTVNQWLLERGLNKIPVDMYPETGIIMQDETTGQGIIAGFVWKTNSKLYQVGFITKNPHFKRNGNPEQSTDVFVKQLLLYAKDEGAEYIATWTENQSLVKCFKDIGFQEPSNRTSELISKIV